MGYEQREKCNNSAVLRRFYKDFECQGKARAVLNDRQDMTSLWLNEGMMVPSKCQPC